MSREIFKFGILILAAGNSSRLGRPKQLLNIGGKTLIRHTIDEAVKVAENQVMVVTGAYSSLLEDELHDCKVHLVHNLYWQEGMSSSIFTGLITLINIYPYLDAVLISVCDQPFISASIFEQLILQHQQTKKGIVAAAYSNTAGVPVLFTSPYFINLLQLKGNEGAKALLKEFPDDYTYVDFANGYIDLDTREDVAQWTANNI